MTMQTTSLPFQVSGAGAPNQPQRPAAAGVRAAEAGDFSATLSRAMAPAVAPPKQADKPAAQAPGTAARAPARQNQAPSDASATAQQAAGDAGSTEPGKDAVDADAESAKAAAEAATTPVTDMLAFMAGLAQAAPPLPAVPALGAPLAAQAAATGADLELAALQSTFAQQASADGAAAAGDPGLAATGGDAAGFALPAGVQPAADQGADLRALQQTAHAAVPAGGQENQGKPQQQARELAAVEAPAPNVTQLQVQASRLEALATPSAMPADRIAARVGTQAWDNQLSQRIVYMVGKEQAATLTLNPPDLGPVQVVLNVSNEGASVAFSANQQEVRQALENALPRLREMMSESGIALGNATVDAGMPDQRQAQQDGERRHGGGASFGKLSGNDAANEDGAAARPVTRTVVPGDRGMVDTFA